MANAKVVFVVIMFKMECWDVPVGEELVGKPQDNNSSDSYTVAILRTCDDKTVGYLLRKIYVNASSRNGKFFTLHHYREKLLLWYSTLQFYKNNTV